MSSRTVHAIVLRRRDAGESDRRLTLLTEELGVVEAVARGARKAASRLAGPSEPLSASAFQLAAGKRTWYVTQAQTFTAYPGLRSDFEKLCLGLALAELAECVLPYGQPAPEAFRFLVEALRYLEVHEKPLVATVWAELGLLRIAGFAPQFGSCVVTGAPPTEAEPFVSPSAGGYVRAAESVRFPDRFRTRIEVLIGLHRTALVERPPTNLKFARDGYTLLLRFWRHLAERSLPAREAAQAMVQSARSGSEPGSPE